MEKGRAYRRAQTERIKRARRKWWGRTLSPKELGEVAKTPTPCSCYMCGNPRKHWSEPPIQERRALQVDHSE